MVRAYIYQCRNLPPADDNGLADPYVKIWDQKLKVTATKIVYKSLNPVFYSVKDFSMDVLISSGNSEDPEKIFENFPPILLDIWDVDKDLMQTTKDYLCRAHIHLNEGSARMLDKEHNVTYESEYIREIKNKNFKVDSRLQQKPKNFDLTHYDDTICDKEVNGIKPPPAKWHACRTTPTGPMTGEILVAFDIISAQDAFP